MPAHLKVKAIPSTGQKLKTSKAVLQKLRKDIESVVASEYEHFSVETVATYIHENPMRQGEYDFYLHVLELRTLHGYDTRESLRAIVDNLDKPLSDIVSSKMQLQIMPTNQVRVWNWTKSPSIDDTHVILPQWLETYSNTFRVLVIMEVSKLLYCRQVQLSEEEFEDDGETLVIKANPSLSIGSNYFYWPLSNEIRVCVEDYLPVSKADSNFINREVEYPVVFIMWFTNIYIVILIN